MSISQERLDELAWEDYRVREERLRAWIDIADKEIQEEAPRETVYALLFWAQVEFRRRRVYLNLSTPDIELQGALVLRRLEARGAEASAHFCPPFPFSNCAPEQKTL